MTGTLPVGQAPSQVGRIRVVIAEDQTMFADALQRLIDAEADLHTVACVGSAPAAIAAVRAKEPDVVVMDYRLEDGDGVAATRHIKNVRPETQVLMLTAFSEPSLLISAMEAGCSGFLMKDSQAVLEVVSAVRRAHLGEAVIDPFLLAQLMPRLRTGSGESNGNITPREREILLLIARGVSSGAIAAEMALSVHTVRNHVQNLMKKLGAHSRLEAVFKAVRQGVIPPA